MPTESRVPRTLARTVGASHVTVSRAIAQLVEDGYLRTEPGRGCFVNDDGKNGKVRTATIGVLLCVSEGENVDRTPSFAHTLLAIQNALIRHDRPMLTLRGLFTGTIPDRYVSPETVAARRLAGVLVLGITDVRYLAQLSAAQALAGRGLKRIAFVGGPFPSPRPFALHSFHRYDTCARERFDGWRVGLRASGLHPAADLAVLTPTRNLAEVQKALAERLRTAPRPDGIVTEFPDGAAAAMDWKCMATGGEMVETGHDS